MGDKRVGEMNSEELAVTTMNPSSRTIRRIEIEDAIAANNITSILMGSDVAPRRKFIEEHALEADVDI